MRDGVATGALFNYYTNFVVQLIDYTVFISCASSHHPCVRTTTVKLIPATSTDAMFLSHIAKCRKASALTVRLGDDMSVIVNAGSALTAAKYLAHE